MLRYVKQPNKTTCGPIAIINLMKWAGQYATVQDLEMVSRFVGHKDGYGTQIYNMHRALWSLNSITVVKNSSPPKLKDMDEHLDSGGAVLVRYFHESGGHFVLYVGRTKKWYWTVNDFANGSSLRRRHRRTVRKQLRNTYRDIDIPRKATKSVCHSMAWFVEK